LNREKRREGAVFAQLGDALFTISPIVVPSSLDVVLFVQAVFFVETSPFCQSRFFSTTASGFPRSPEPARG
jgi:hypothetical protein